MVFQLLSNIIFLGCLVGIFLLIVRRLPEALGTVEEQAPEQQLAEKGLPTLAVNRGKVLLRTVSRRIWAFALEAKGLRHSSVINYRIKQIFRKPAVTNVPLTAFSGDGVSLLARDEQYYLQRIKQSPHDLRHYEQLGEFYQQQGNHAEAVPVYEYLAKHAPHNQSYFGKLGLSKLSLKDYDGALAAYQEAVKLDSSHPNRYYNLSLVYIALKQWPEAEQAVNDALALDRGNKKYRQTLEQIKQRAVVAQSVEQLHGKE